MSTYCTCMNIIGVCRFHVSDLASLVRVAALKLVTEIFGVSADDGQAS